MIIRGKSKISLRVVRFRLTKTSIIETGYDLCHRYQMTKDQVREVFKARRIIQTHYENVDSSCLFNTDPKKERMRRIIAKSNKNSVRLGCVIFTGENFLALKKWAR